MVYASRRFKQSVRRHPTQNCQSLVFKFGKYACLQTDGLLSDKEQWVWNIENSSLVARFGVRNEDLFSSTQMFHLFQSSISHFQNGKPSFYNRQKSQFSTAILTELIGEDIEWGQVTTAPQVNASANMMTFHHLCRNRIKA